MLKRFFAVVVSLGLCISTHAQSPVPPAPPPPAPMPVSDGNVVAGLELPPDQTVSSDEGFVNIQAKCKGEVKWLVVANEKIKFMVVPSTMTLIVAVPASKAEGYIINVFAVGVVDGKLTEFARTNITVGVPPPEDPVNPPGPIPVAGKLHLTFLIDLNAPTPDMARLLNSQSLRKNINQRGHWFRMYDVKDPIVQKKNLTSYVLNGGVLIIQDDAGKVLSAKAIPKTEQEIIALIQQLTGR